MSQGKSHGNDWALIIFTWDLIQLMLAWLVIYDKLLHCNALYGLFNKNDFFVHTI